MFPNFNFLPQGKEMELIANSKSTFKVIYPPPLKGYDKWSKHMPQI